MHLTSPNRLSLSLDTTRVMGVLNVTPDSFSDGGQFDTVELAVAHASTMLEQGADVIDVGGESTRPGAPRMDDAEQIRRVAPTIKAIHEQFPQAWVSIDTTRYAVAQAALNAGACMLNDVTGGRESRSMFQLAAEHHVPIVLMHMQGKPTTMQDDPQYEDVAADIRRFLLSRAVAAERAGIPSSQIILDPGIGFGKTAEHNLTLLAKLDQFVSTGYAVMLGASRKRFIGPDLDPSQRLGGTLATTVLAAQTGVAMVRVHDVSANRQAIEMVGRVASV